MTRGVLVVGSPATTRGAAFAAAWRRADPSAPLRWVSWAAVAQSAAAVAGLGAPGDFLRIDPPGDDPEVLAALARRGGLEDGADPAEHGAGRAFFGGLSETLHAIERHAAHLVPTHPAESVLGMMDKRLCHHRLRDAGLPVPQALPSERIRNAAALRAALQAAGLHAVLVKRRWEPTGAAALSYRWRGEAEQLTVREPLAGEGTQGEAPLGSYTDRGSIDRLLDRVLGEGAVVERWLPRGDAEGGPNPLRVLTVAGQPAHGGARLDLDLDLDLSTRTRRRLDAAPRSLEETLAPWGQHTKAAVFDVCRAVAACFPAHLALGVDLLLDPRGRPHVLALHPWADGLLGPLPGGEDAVETQVRAMQAAATGQPLLG